MFDHRFYRLRINFFLVFLLISLQGIANYYVRAVSLNPMDPPQKVLIYWDTSLSMSGRNLEVEFELLSAYLESLGGAQVELVPFDHQMGKSLNHQVENGDIASLKSNITSLSYDGVALFKLLDLDEEAYAILIFSDGVSVIDDLDMPEGKDVFLINSLSGSEVLQRRVYHRNYLDLDELGLGGALQRLGVVNANVSITMPAKKDADVAETGFRIPATPPVTAAFFQIPLFQPA